MLGWVQLFLTPAPTLCGGLLYVYFVLQFQFSAELQENQGKIRGCSKPLLRTGTLLLLPIYSWLKEIQPNPKPVHVESIHCIFLLEGIGKSQAKVGEFIFVLQGRSRTVEPPTPFCYIFLPDYVNKVTELIGLLWDLSKIIYFK